VGFTYITPINANGSYRHNSFCIGLALYFYLNLMQLEPTILYKWKDL